MTGATETDWHGLITKRIADMQSYHADTHELLLAVYELRITTDFSQDYSALTVMSGRWGNNEMLIELIITRIHEEELSAQRLAEWCADQLEKVIALFEAVERYIRQGYDNEYSEGHPRYYTGLLRDLLEDIDITHDRVISV